MSGMATPTEGEQLSEIMDRVKTWSLTMKIALAKHVLDTLEAPMSAPSTRGRPVEELIGIGTGASPPPDDGQVRSWIDDHCREKWG